MLVVLGVVVEALEVALDVLARAEVAVVGLAGVEREPLEVAGSADSPLLEPVLDATPLDVAAVLLETWLDAVTVTVALEDAEQAVPMVLTTRTTAA